MRDKLKKSESLEIRLPYPTKQAFMARCQHEGRSASEAMRGFIDGYLEPAQAPAAKPRAGWKLIAAGTAAVLIGGAVAAPVLARTALSPTQAVVEFKKLDVDGDGKLSLAEFQHLHGR